MSKSSAGLQDIVLNAARKDKIPVTLHLMNGVPLKGIIRGFDPFVVLLDSEGKQQMIYKHAISTITPMRPVQYSGYDDDIDNEEE